MSQTMREALMSLARREDTNLTWADRVLIGKVITALSAPSSEQAQQGAEPVTINGEAPNAHNLLAALVDIYDDGQKNPPEHRSYVEGAWADLLTAARTFLASRAAATAPADPYIPLMAEQAMTIDRKMLRSALVWHGISRGEDSDEAFACRLARHVNELTTAIDAKRREATAPACPLCHGRGGYGIPGAQCEWCKGTGKMIGPATAPAGGVTDAWIESYIRALPGEGRMPTMTPGVASYWLTAEELSGMVAALQTARAAEPDIEAAAKKLAECMDYPWEPMPEQGRTNMRKHAKAVLDAATPPTTKDGGQHGA